jgi:hypothetical protein
VRLNEARAGRARWSTALGRLLDAAAVRDRFGPPAASRWQIQPAFCAAPNRFRRSLFAAKFWGPWAVHEAHLRR